MSHHDRRYHLARDLTKEYSRSPRETLGGYVSAARTLDKCMTVIVGSEGEYHYECPLDREFFDFTKIDSMEFRPHVESEPTDDEMDICIRKHTKVKRERRCGELEQQMAMHASSRSPDTRSALYVRIYSKVYSQESSRLCLV